MHFHKYTPNTSIVKQGTTCKQLIFILSGSVQSESADSRHSYTIEETFTGPHVIEPYSLFGMHTSYTASYKALTEVTALIIDKSYVVAQLNNYEIFLKNNSLGDLDYKLFKSLKLDKSNISNNRVNTKIEVDLFEGEIPSLSLYVVGKNNNISTKPSNIVNILPKLENIEEEVIENLVEKIDDENNIVTLTWDKLNIKDVTYSVYVKDNKNGENGFTLYENSLQENYISIPIKEDFNIDVYVIGSKDGKFSKQSNIINVKI